MSKYMDVMNSLTNLPPELNDFLSQSLSDTATKLHQKGVNTETYDWSKELASLTKTAGADSPANLNVQTAVQKVGSGEQVVNYMSKTIPNFSKLDFQSQMEAIDIFKKDPGQAFNFVQEKLKSGKKTKTSKSPGFSLPKFSFGTGSLEAGGNRLVSGDPSLYTK